MCIEKGPEGHHYHRLPPSLLAGMGRSEKENSEGEKEERELRFCFTHTLFFPYKCALLF